MKNEENKIKTQKETYLQKQKFDRETHLIYEANGIKPDLQCFQTIANNGFCIFLGLLLTKHNKLKSILNHALWIEYISHASTTTFNRLH